MTGNQQNQNAKHGEQRVLRLTLHREHFAKIIEGKKPYEFRDLTVLGSGHQAMALLSTRGLAARLVWTRGRPGLFVDQPA